MGDDVDAKYFQFKKFQKIAGHEEIELKSFLEASANLLDFIALLGVVFTPVHSDISQNIKTLTNASAKKSIKMDSVGDLVCFYSKIKSLESETILSALLWLNRALEYIYYFLKLFIDDYYNGNKNPDLTPLFMKAYKKTLRQHHNLLIQGIVSVCMRAVPSRKVLIQTLLVDKTDNDANIGADEEKLFVEMRDYHIRLSSNIDSINNLLQSD